MNQLVKRTGNHPYAVLFRDVCFSENVKDAPALMKSYVWSIWDTISDQIEHAVVSPQAGRSLVDLQIIVNEIGHLIESDANRLAEKIAENPSQVPSRVGKRGAKVDPTTEILTMSEWHFRQAKKADIGRDG